MEYSVFYNEKTRGYALKQSNSILDPTLVVRTFKSNSYIDALRLATEITDEIIECNRIPVIIIDHLEEPVFSSIYNNLNEFQRITSGTIDIVNCSDLDEFDIICNDEGKLCQMPLNRALLKNGKVYDIVAGTMIVTKSDMMGETIGLTYNEIDRVHSYFYYPELFSVTRDYNNISVIKTSFEMAKLMKQNLISNVSITK